MASKLEFLKRDTENATRYGYFISRKIALCRLLSCLNYELFGFLIHQNETKIFLIHIQNAKKKKFKCYLQQRQY